MSYPENDNTPDIEFFGDGWTPNAPMVDDLIDVGREPSTPSWVLRATQKPIIVAAYVIVISLGVFVVTHRVGPPRTLTAFGATPAATAPSSSAPRVRPTLGVGPDMNTPPQCYQVNPVNGTTTGPAIDVVPFRVSVRGGNHQAVTRAKLSPLPRAHVTCGQLIFPISVTGRTTGIQQAIIHDLPGARIGTTTTTARINTPGQQGVISSRVVVARLHRHRIVIRVRAAGGHSRLAPARHLPAGVLYRHEVVSFGYLIDIEVTGPAGWTVPRAALAKLAHDPRIVAGY